MVSLWRQRLASKLLSWSHHLQRTSERAGLPRQDMPILIFFHGSSLACVTRQRVVARALQKRGYPVVLAGRGSYVERLLQDGFEVADVETFPQERIDAHRARREYEYYDLDEIDRCVRSERMLLKRIKPRLVIQDMKPTVGLATRLEGIDEAVVLPAFHQPGYPHFILRIESFPWSSGAFTEYLAQAALEVKPEQKLCLMDDIPALHPPPAVKGAGFHYVGPLIDLTRKMEEGEEVSNGWDRSLPLVYLSCERSVDSLDFLDGVIERWEGKPYRLLVTTGGRWTGSVARENVRVRASLSMEAVVSQAHVLAGIIERDALYQALRWGVPLLGTPEDLDQEYHLNRVEALGLGMKLDRDAFAPDAILAALDHLLDHYPVFKASCQDFAPFVKEWQGGDRVVDIVDGFLRFRQKAYAVTREYLMEEAEFVAHIDPGSSLSRETWTRILRESVKRGLPCWRQGRTLFFDRIDSWNWLYDKVPRLFEAKYRALEENRRRFFVQEKGRVRLRVPEQRYRVTYEYRIFPDILTPGQQVKVFLPYPTASCSQRNIRFVSCEPAEMKEYLAPSFGFFFGYPVTRGTDDTSWRFSYTCEATVQEQSISRNGQERVLSALERQRYLELEPDFTSQPEVIQFHQKIGGKGNDEERARSIFRELVYTKRFKKTRDSIPTLGYYTRAVLNDEGGHCVSLSRAFIALCRAEGIPAREASGAFIIGASVNGKIFHKKSYRDIIFGHTWAEIFLDGKGWIPVDFHPVDIGPVAMTGENVVDPELKDWIVENTAPYTDYYFGRVDNLRLICSNSVKEIPQCLVEIPGLPEEEEKRWDLLPDLRFACELRAECI